MSSILDPVVSDATQQAVCRIVRQWSADQVVYSYFEDADFTAPLDISDWVVTVADVDRLLCRIVDGPAGPAIEGPYLPFVQPADPTAAAVADFEVTRPAANAYAVAYPSNTWPWPIPLPNPLLRRPQDPLVVVRTQLDKGHGIIDRVPLLLAVRPGGAA